MATPGARSGPRRRAGFTRAGFTRAGFTRAVATAWACAGLVAGCGEPRGGEAVLTRFEFQEPHMGTAVRIVVHAPDRRAAEVAAAAAFRTVGRLDSLFSDYRDDSEIAALAAEAGTGVDRPLSPELAQVLDTAVAWAARTDGAFDVTLGPLTRLWRWGVRRGELPDPARLAEARARVGISGLVLEPGSGRARLTRPGMSLDLGGIAKGFAAGAALDTLRARGLPVALVDAGGDLALGRPPPGEEGWRIEFPGGDVHRLADRAVATSGDRYRFIEVAGVRYSHILDPRTGFGLVDAPTVAVVAPTAVTADVLASALGVLDESRGRALVAGLEGVAVRVMPRDPAGGGGWQTDGFPTPPRRH